MAHKPISGYCPFYDGTRCHASTGGDNIFPSLWNQETYCTNEQEYKSCLFLKRYQKFMSGM